MNYYHGNCAVTPAEDFSAQILVTQRLASNCHLSWAASGTRSTKKFLTLTLISVRASNNSLLWERSTWMCQLMLIVWTPFNSVSKWYPLSHASIFKRLPLSLFFMSKLLLLKITHSRISITFNLHLKCYHTLLICRHFCLHPSLII